MVLQEREYVSVSSSMCLSLDWCHTGSKNQIAPSHSDGLISVVDVGQAKTVVLLSAEVHEFETCTTSYDCWDPELLYSGADDSHFVLGIFAKALIPLFFGTARGTTWEFVAFRATQKLREHVNHGQL